MGASDQRIDIVVVRAVDRLAVLAQETADGNAGCGELIFAIRAAGPPRDSSEPIARDLLRLLDGFDSFGQLVAHR